MKVDISKNRGILSPKMDGENHGKPLKKRDDLGGKTHYVRKHPGGHAHKIKQPNISKPLSQENQAAKNAMETRLLTVWDCRDALPK